MDHLFCCDDNNKLSLLPQVMSIISNKERFDKSKYESIECLSRNSALAWGIQHFCNAYSDENGVSCTQALVVDSGFNMTSFFCMIAAKLIAVDMEVHAISNSVYWDYNGNVDEHTAFYSYQTIEQTLSFIEVTPEIVFLDVCNCVHTILGDIVETLEGMSDKGGIWGLSFTSSHFSPTNETIKLDQQPSRVKKVIKDYRVGSYDSKKMDLRDWVLKYCLVAGINAKFHLQLYWEEKVKATTTMLFRVVPITKKAPIPFIISSKEAIVEFWSQPSLRSLLTSHKCIFIKHFCNILGDDEEYSDFLESIK